MNNEFWLQTMGIAAFVAHTFISTWIIKKHTLKRVGNFKGEHRPLTSQDLLFIGAWTGHELSEDELRKHILAIHSEIENNAHVYRCISIFNYLNPKIRQLPWYTEVVEAAKRLQSGYSILDLGTCFGQETRALIDDGVSPKSITVSDIHDVYWKAGLRLYLDDSTLPHGKDRSKDVKSIFGDWAVDLAAPNDIAQNLQNSFDCVISLAILHVLSKKQSKNMLRRISRVLKTGGILIGYCAGVVGQSQEWWNTPDDKDKRWLYCAQDLKDEFSSVGMTDIVVVETPWEDRVFLGFYAKKI